MHDLIKIEKRNIDGAEINSVNLRELHSILESKRQFADYAKGKLGRFVENEDFTVHKFVNGKATQIDYIVTIETAKMIAMMENNEIGDKIRKYFIEVEKQANKPLSFEEMAKQTILLADKKIKELESKILEDKPKVEFFDSVANSKTALDMSKVAKVLNKNIGRNRLFEILRDRKILQQNNDPYQKYIDNGYFRVIETKYKKPDGSTHISTKTLVYQRGVDFINKIVGE